MNEMTLYERIGGESAIDRLIDTFYDRVLADSELAPFFAQTSMDKLRRMQKAFFSIALDGPEIDSHISLTAAHAGRGIERRHLSRFTDHLLQTFRGTGIEETSANEIVGRIATYSEQILGETTVDG